MLLACRGAVAVLKGAKQTLGPALMKAQAVLLTPQQGSLVKTANIRSESQQTEWSKLKAI